MSRNWSDRLRATVYEIQHLPTGHRYIGSTLYSPCTRWGSQVSRLRAHKHANPALQALWDTSQFSDWVFHVLQTDIPASEQFQAEGKWITALRPECNVVTTGHKCLTRSPEMIAQVLALREAGKTFREIALTLNLHLATTHAIVKRYVPL